VTEEQLLHSKDVFEGCSRELLLKQSYANLGQDLLDQNEKGFSQLQLKEFILLQLHLTTIIKLFTDALPHLILCLTIILGK
jgi:hypothetical protein